MCTRGTGSLAHLEQQSDRARAALWKGFGYNKEFKLEAARTDCDSPHEGRQGWAVICQYWDFDGSWDSLRKKQLWLGIHVHLWRCGWTIRNSAPWFYRPWVTLLGEESNSACSHLHVRDLSSSSEECFLGLQ